MVKTTINIEDELWKKFSIKVIEDYGGRMKTDVIEALVEEFVKDPSKTIDEALRDLLEEPSRKRKHRGK